MWALSLDGDVAVTGNKNSVDIGFNDIWDNLNFAGMVEFEARENRLGVFINPLISQLEDDNDLLDLTIDLDIVSFGAFYRLGPWTLDPSVDARGDIVVDLYAGGRCPGHWHGATERF